MTRLGIVAALALILGCASPDVGGSVPRIRIENGPREDGPATVVVAGLSPGLLDRLSRLDDDGWERAFPVRIIRGSAADEMPPVLGQYTIEGRIVRFTPRFPFDPGVDYNASFRAKRLPRSDDGPIIPAEISLDFSIPPIDRPPPQVIAVHPGPGDRPGRTDATVDVPSNLLRVYVEFSDPMLPRDVHEHVRLLDASGNPVALPFVEVDSGLWDPDGRRLTLFLHPGRVKRGVGPHEALGPVLDQGGLYRLVIAAGMRNAAGVPLARNHEVVYRAISPDRTSPDPALWTIHPPDAPDAPLVIGFHERLDHALAARMIRVAGVDGTILPGAVELTDSDRGWRFTPEGEWPAGDLRILVQKGLEDPAGNAIGRRFEEPIGHATAEQGEPGDAISIPFRWAPR